MPLTGEWNRELAQAATEMADRGMRVLAFAYRVLPEAYVRAEAEQDLVIAALVGFEDPPRAEVPAAVHRCRDAGIKIVMVTGDHPHTALAIAREVGIVQNATATLLTGDDLARLSDIQLQLALDAPEIVCARVSAEQKLRIVAAFQRKRCIVAVTGDGVNDARRCGPQTSASRWACRARTWLREAADLVSPRRQLRQYRRRGRGGRAVFENIGKFLTYILTSNIPELVPLSGVRVHADAAGTDRHPDSCCRSRDRYGSCAGPRR
jgi:magnesium-transporting ATPase (P-type)